MHELTGSSLAAAGRMDKGDGLVYEGILQYYILTPARNEAELQLQSRLILQEWGKGISQGTELQGTDLIAHFGWKQRWPRVLLYFHL